MTVIKGGTERKHQGNDSKLEHLISHNGMKRQRYWR